MRTIKYYTITNFQLFLMAIVVGVISSSLLVINTKVNEYLHLPVVVYSDDKCVSVENYVNGQAFTCADVDLTLRNYRKKQEK